MHDRSDFADFPAHIGNRAEWQRLLVVNAAVENQPITVVAHQARQVHPGTAPLQRIEDVDANFVDEVR